LTCSFICSFALATFFHQFINSSALFPAYDSLALVMADESPGEAASTPAPPQPPKILTELPVEMLLAVIVRIDFSPTDLLNLSLAKKQIRALMLKHKQKLLNEIADVQFPEAECMRSLLGEAKDNTISTLLRSKDSSIMIGFITDVFFLSADSRNSSHRGQALLSCLHLFEGLHELRTFRDREVDWSAIIVHLDIQVLRLMHFTSIMLREVWKGLLAANSDSAWHRLESTDKLEYVFQDLLLKYGVQFLAEIFLGLWPHPATKSMIGSHLSAATGSALWMQSNTRLEDHISLFRTVLIHTEVSSRLSFPSRYFAHAITAGYGSPGSRIDYDKVQASWSTLASGYLLWDLMDLPDPSSYPDPEDFFETFFAQFTSFCLHNPKGINDETLRKVCSIVESESGEGILEVMGQTDWRPCVTQSLLRIKLAPRLDWMKIQVKKIQKALAVVDGLSQEWMDQNFHKMVYGMMISLEKMKKVETAVDDDGSP
jgi:hypothetical protein